LGLFILYLIISLVKTVLTSYELPEWALQLDLAAIIVLYCAVARLLFYVLVDAACLRPWLRYRSSAIARRKGSCPRRAYRQRLADAIAKAVESAKKHLISVPLAGTTIPHLVRGEDGAGTVVLRPASKGTGVIAGGAVRVIVELAGIKDILTKSIRSNNPFSASKLPAGHIWHGRGRS
jgi:hypothetical protein